jgi:hypothetical protein
MVNALATPIDIGTDIDLCDVRMRYRYCCEK